MKLWKRMLIAVAATAALLAAIWLGGRYGWRLLGFQACTGSGIDRISVTDSGVTIHGFYPGSFPSGCVGTLYRQEGDILYFGVRYDAIWGVFEVGSFEADIPLSEPIQQVILCAGENQYPIWSASSDGSGD